MPSSKLLRWLTRFLLATLGVFLLSLGLLASSSFRENFRSTSSAPGGPTTAPPTPSVALSPPPTAETRFFPPPENPEPYLQPGLWAAWLSDLTVPDLIAYEPGAAFTKTWRLANVGETAWPTDTVLTFLEGARLSAPLTVPVGMVASASNVDVGVSLRAPEQDGLFVAQWALTTAGRIIPGSRVWLAVTVGDGEADPTPVPQGPFELGGHVFQGLDHAEQMAYAGMTWVKVQVRYPEAAPTDLIARAHAWGFKVLLGAVGDARRVTEPGFCEGFAAWSAGLAAAGADAIEVWNEPNLPREWQEGHISPAAYTRLLCAAYTAVKRANSATLVISAAPAPTGFFRGCHTQGCDDLPWLRGLYAAGAAGCLDYVGAHHNAGATSPSAITGHPADPGGSHHSWYFLPQTYHYYEAFHRTRRIFYTELGYLSTEGLGATPDAFSWAASTRVAQQAQWLAEAVRLSREIGVIRAIIVWNVDATCYGNCGSGGDDPQAGYAIIRPDTSCPACETLHAAMSAAEP
ncbi:MAG: NBR1-Ig-like domain-containing protein [Anaerolineae bacterium]